MIEIRTTVDLKDRRKITFAEFCCFLSVGLIPAYEFVGYETRYDERGV